ncbi:MAG: hypothetical protein ACFFAN_15440, partial [Promethearchaeota archaeon]
MSHNNPIKDMISLKKVTILFITILFTLTLSIFPINIFRGKTNYQESKESKLEEDLMQSTESGGGYTMDPYATYSWIELV